MVEVLQFIFGGTALWGFARFLGVLMLLAVVASVFASFIQLLKSKK